MIARLLMFVLILAAFAGCEQRQPPDRFLVVTMADSLQRREGISWGEPTSVLEPDRADADGRRWWQVTYDAGPHGEPRTILVDAKTGWARFPGPKYEPRVPVTPTAVPVFPHQAQTGSFILLVTGTATADPSARPELEAEVRQLNDLAKNTGLYPLFEIREARGGGLQIIYGWQKDAGIVRDERIQEWLHVRTRFDHSTWVRLDEWK